MVISADKIVIRFLRHIRGGHRNVFITGDIDARRIVDFVVGAGGNRESGNIALAVIEHGGDVGRENALVSIAAFYRRVGPPQEMTRRGVTIKDLTGNFNQRAVRIKRKPGHDLQTAHGLRFPHPYGLHAVFPALDRKVDRHKGRRAMMLRPVELDTAGDPGPQQPHQGGLHNFIVIHEIALFNLVIRPMYTAAEFR